MKKLLIGCVLCLGFAIVPTSQCEAGHGRIKKVLSAPVRLFGRVRENRQAARAERGGLFGICK